MVRIIIAAVALLIPTPTLASVELYERLSGDWFITKESEVCVAGRRYQGGDILAISYDPSNNRMRIGIAVPDATSLKEGEEVQLHVIFVGARKLDEDWGATRFYVSANGGMNQLIGSFNGRQMIRDISRNDIIAFSIDGTAERLVGSYSLDGSAAAMDALRRCSFELQGLNLNDPFLR